MTIRGIGKKLEYIVVPYVILCIVISYYFKSLFSYREKINNVFLIIGAVLLLNGLILHIISAIQLYKAYKREVLETSGMFSLCRNPMYATIILLIIPGLSLLLNSWLVLSASLLTYVLLRIFIKEEEEFLLNKYGKVFDDYRNRTGLIFPAVLRK